MKKHMVFFGVLILALSACRVEYADVPTATPSSPTATATMVEATASPTMTPEQTPSAVEFPLSMLSEQQIQDVADCTIQQLADERYPSNYDSVELPSVFEPVSGCDWAVLASAYAARNDADAPSQAGMDAFGKAVSENYGFALESSLFPYYFSSIPLVQAPAVTEQKIEKVEIHYLWAGLGEPSQVEHTVVIEQAGITPLISSSTDSIAKDLTVDADAIQGIAAGLTDLLPIDSDLQLVFCYDNYPEWDVTLTFTDGTTINLWTRSNFLYVGGPWLTEIDGQLYIQASQDFAVRIAGLMHEMGLPLGEPMAMYCSGGLIFENAFSRFLPPTPTPSPDLTRQAIVTFAAGTVKVRLTEMAAETTTPGP